jgi:hypothetical protein
MSDDELPEPAGAPHPILAHVARLEAINAELLAALKVTLNYWTSTGFAECELGCDCIVESVRDAIAHAEERS